MEQIVIINRLREKVVWRWLNIWRRLGKQCPL